MRRRLPRLYLVTKREVVLEPGFLERARAALAAGGPDCALQLRAHGLEGGRFLALALQLAPAARESGAQLWINDRLDVALAVRAAGVQLGGGSVPTADARRLLGRGAWLGRSAHGATEAVAALDAGADVAVLGHIYATGSHPGGAPLGLAGLREAVSAAGGRPIVAIGGITDQRIAEVVEAGAWGVAAVSGIWEAIDAGAAVRAYREALGSVDGRR